MSLRAPKNLFVYAICGDAHARLVNTSLRFLKHFTSQDVVVVASRCSEPINHDQVMRVEQGEEFDNHQASILLKTNLHRLIGNRAGRCCYLDSDVVAVSAEIDKIFTLKSGPVAFALDHSRMRVFSRWAVHCPCVSGECDHLRQAIKSKFEVEISDPDWRHWNGGVFLFDSESTEFLDAWRRYTRSIFADPGWRTRDQGTLIATVWKQGLQNQPVLPRLYNYIVDAMRGIPDAKRPSLPIAGYSINREYSLEKDSALPRPHFLHFINGSVGRRGWKNWDDAEAMLRSSAAVPQRIAPRTISRTI
ncbi:MAG TPA: hypothetical protein VEZ90_16380 [Blastocatellia bacterium]|nr:hypothetical protein [Blastocatellia bacterium]